jgi:hypothetical protein
LRSKNINGRFTVDFVNTDGLKVFIESKVYPFVQHIASLIESSPDAFMTRNIDEGGEA